MGEYGTLNGSRTVLLIVACQSNAGIWHEKAHKLADAVDKLLNNDFTNGYCTDVKQKITYSSNIHDP